VLLRAQLTVRRRPAQNGPSPAIAHAKARLDAGEVDAAISLCEAAIARRPRDAWALQLLGVALLMKGRWADAVEPLRRSAAAKPDNAEFVANHGMALIATGDFAGAEPLLREAIAIAPDFPPAHWHLANVLTALGRFEEALAAFDRACAVAPVEVAPRIGRATVLLRLGRFAEGWRAYLDRPAVAPVAARYRRTPLPANLAGRHVVVEGEQGIGDELSFLRFAEGLRRRGAQVTYLADPRLVAMIGRAAIVDEVRSQDDDPGDLDFRVAVGDLPWLLGAGDADPPPPFPIPPLQDREWTILARLKSFGPPPWIGLTWRAGSVGDAFTGNLFGLREVPLDRLASAVRGIDATPVIVQRLPRAGEIATLEALLGRRVLDLSSLNDDLEAMLALMGLLDLYICVSNTNLHLGAAQARPAAVLVTNPPDFRWMMRADVCPWFPHARAYCQALDGSWTSAFAALRQDLRGG